MADIVTMPKLGFDMAEGTLVRWVKSEGDDVQKGDVLAEIETDKATVEVESSFTGKVFKHLVEEGTVVPVGTPIGVIAQEGEQPDLTQIQGAGVEEGEERGSPKTEPERPLPEQPQPKDVQREEGAQVVQGEQAPAAAAAQEEEGGEEEVQTPDGRVLASPLARKIAEDRGLNLRRIKGTGPGGRITKRDVEAAAQQAPAAAPRQAAPAAAPVQTPAAAPQQAAPAQPQVAIPLPAWQAGQAQAPQDEHVSLTKLRSIIGRRMTESKQAVPHFYVTHDYKMDKVMQFRKEANALLPNEQKISVNDFIVKATAYALRQFPNLNASLGENEIVRHGRVNVGVAVAVEAGLLTVVCKDADQKPLRVISQEIKEMVGRARDGKVRPDDIEGSTFSISNLGMYDVDEFVAIINPPEVAILAIGSVQQVPVVEEGQVKVGSRMKLTLSADHRVTDGAEAAQFMQALALFLEEPMRLMV